jgi:hypothetical protein
MVFRPSRAEVREGRKGGRKLNPGLIKPIRIKPIL